MAISERKLAANRANACSSTGPRTPEGKAAVARNALIHGLSARGALLPGDDPREYQRFGQRIFNELEPAGALQEELATEIVNLSWKLRRVPGAESVLLVEAHGKSELPPMRVICNMIVSKRAWDHTTDSPLWLLDRYAARIERARASALRMLLALQKRQRDDEDEGDDFGSEPARHAQPGASDAGSENTPGQNKATAGPDRPEAQPVLSTGDGMLDTPAAGEPAAPSKATAPGGDSFAAGA